MSVSHPQRSRVNQATPKMKEDMDDLLHFVKKLEQTENRNPNAIVFQTPSNKQKVPDDVAESPSVVVNINPSEYLERINRRKMIFAEKHAHDNTILKAQVKKKDLEIQRRKSENQELKEKLKSFAEQQDKEHKMLQESFNNNKNKAIGSPVLVPGNILDLSQSREASIDYAAGRPQSQTRIKGSKPKSKSKSSFLGFHCCGTER